MSLKCKVFLHKACYWNQIPTEGWSGLEALNKTTTGCALSERSEFAHLRLSLVPVFSLRVFLSCPVFFLFASQQKERITGAGLGTHSTQIFVN